MESKNLIGEVIMSDGTKYITEFENVHEFVKGDYKLWACTGEEYDAYYKGKKLTRPSNDCDFIECEELYQSQINQIELNLK